MIGREERATAVRLLLLQEKGRRRLERLAAGLRARMASAVGRSPELTERLEGRRHRVLGAEVWILEPGKDLLRATRYAEISAYDYERDVLLSAVSDVATGRVVEIREHPGLQPPPTSEEVSEAAQLVVDTEPGLRRRWRAQRIVPTAVVAREASIEGHPAFGHRALTLWFWSRTTRPRRVAGPFLVDLSRRTVPAQEERPD